MCCFFYFVAGSDMRVCLTAVDVMHLALVTKKKSPQRVHLYFLRCLLHFKLYLLSSCTLCQNKHTQVWNARSMSVASSMSVFQELHPALKMMTIWGKTSESFLGVFLYIFWKGEKPGKNKTYLFDIYFVWTLIISLLLIYDFCY